MYSVPIYRYWNVFDYLFHIRNSSPNWSDQIYIQNIQPTATTNSLRGLENWLVFSLEVRHTWIHRHYLIRLWCWPEMFAIRHSRQFSQHWNHRLTSSKKFPAKNTNIPEFFPRSVIPCCSPVAALDCWSIKSQLILFTSNIICHDTGIWREVPWSNHHQPEDRRSSYSW